MKTAAINNPSFDEELKNCFDRDELFALILASEILPEPDRSERIKKILGRSSDLGNLRDYQCICDHLRLTPIITDLEKIRDKNIRDGNLEIVEECAELLAQKITRDEYENMFFYFLNQGWQEKAQTVLNKL